MDFKKQLRYFYLFTLPPLIIFSIIVYLFDSLQISVALFVFGYVFCLVGKTPGIDNFVSSPRYKWSFIRLCYWINKKINSKFVNSNIWVKKIILILIPSIFILFSEIILGLGINFFYTLLGALLCEILVWSLNSNIPKNVLTFHEIS